MSQDAGFPAGFSTNKSGWHSAEMKCGGCSGPVRLDFHHLKGRARAFAFVEQPIGMLSR